jgi:hypothetical protein
MYVLVLLLTIWYHQIVLDYTWNDLEAEIVLNNLNVPHAEQQRLHSYYLKLREEYRKALAASPSSQEDKPGAR